MLPREQFSRINLVQLKALIIRRIGHQNAVNYFEQLKRLFGSKISKREFDKFCVRVVGEENIGLHNSLIRSIVKNACLAKVPPVNVGNNKGSLNINLENGNQRISLQSPYKDTCPPSPRKCRSSVNHDRKHRIRPSSLGPLGKPHCVLHEEVVSKAQEQQSATELHSLGSRPPVEVPSVEDGEEVEQFAGSPSVQSKSPVTAPLGVSLNMGCARQVLSDGSVSKPSPDTCHISGELHDTRSLRNRLEQKLQMEGLSISLDCASLLNISLDVYLKRLIEACMELATSRCVSEHLREQHGQRMPHLRGVSPRRWMAMSNNSVCASMLDFRTAMELNPQLLGENWAVKLARICLQVSEE